MKLTRLGLLTFLVQWGRDSSQVREERCEGQPVQHLRDTCFEDVVIFILTPISGRKSSLKTCGDGFSLKVFRQIVLQPDLVIVSIPPSSVIDLLIDCLFHLFDDFSEFLLEDHVDKGSRHVESFLTVVVSVIFNGSAEMGLDESICHVSCEERFLEFIAMLDTDMGK